MFTRESPDLPRGLRRALIAALLGGASLIALIAATERGEARSARSAGSGAVAPTAAAQQAAAAAAQQAAAAQAQAQASLARAAAALAAARRAQQDAAAAARAGSSSVPNGLTIGGLMPAGGTSADPLAGITADPSKWQGAQHPTQTTNGSQVRVDVNQTQSKAILTWDTFNVGSNTLLNFNQGASTWIALNRVLDPSGAPSQILGAISAPGAVYVINRNGIIFGAGSQVNVHTLVASVLDVGKLGYDLTARDAYFLNTGIGNLNSFSLFDPVGGAATRLIPGDIKVEAGASITANIATDVVSLGSPGQVYLFGANVYNWGAISAPNGQVGMAASRAIDLTPNSYAAASFPSEVLPSGTTFRGTGWQLQSFADPGLQIPYDDAGNTTNSYYRNEAIGVVTGEVTSGGLIETRGGIVTLAGDRVKIDSLRDPAGSYVRDAAGNLIQGVISADTSISRNSMVLLHAATSVDMNGVISIGAYDDGTTLPLGSGSDSSSTVQAFMPAYVEMTAGRRVAMGSNGLVSAPSASVSLNAVTIGSSTTTRRLFDANRGTSSSANLNPTLGGPRQVLLAGADSNGLGATIDVAGLQNVELPATNNFISFQPRAEFADMPLQRNGVLYGETLWIDIRASGTRSDGTTWVGTPLADASGYVNAVGRKIDQLMTVGGKVSLTTDLNTNGTPSVTQAAGSVINVAGGSVKFASGWVPSTVLLGIDGRLYGMANADPNMTYVGIAGRFTADHARWGVTEIWSSFTRSYQPGYTEGRDAGAVTITTVSPVLQGEMLFGSAAGERQIATGKWASQGAFTLTTPSSVVIGSTASSNFVSQSAVTTTLSADTLSSYGLSALTITANDLVVSSGSTLDLAPGGSFSATVGGAIDIAGTVHAAGGKIDLVTDRRNSTFVNVNLFGNLFKAPTDQSGAILAANVFVGGTLDVSGRFVNDVGRFGTGAGAQGPAFIDGGTISITTNKDSSQVNGGPFHGQWVDKTGSILLAKSSVLDVSSGGYISAQGKPKTASTGVMAGKAGSISLVLYQGANEWGDPENPSGRPERPTPAASTVAQIGLDGTLRAYGFESNGSLRLGSADTIRIGGTLQPGETSAIKIGGVSTTLPVSLLNGGGFGAYILETIPDGWSGATANITVSAGVNLTLQQQNLASVADYGAVPTGTKVASIAPRTVLPDDRRKPVDLTLKADNILLDTGASIVTDPKARITLGGSPVVDQTPRDRPATNVRLFGSIVNHAGTVSINSTATWLGSQASIDLSGIFVANSRFGLPGGPTTSGTLLDGGTLAIVGAERTNLVAGTTDTYTTYGASGYVVADAGARVDVSGYAGEIQVGGARGATSSVWSWSDAGAVIADVAGFAWGGSFVAMGGRSIGADGTAHADPRANNGTLIVGGGAVQLRQDTTDVVARVAAFHAGTGPSSVWLAADQLSPFDNLYIYSGSSPGGPARIFTDYGGNSPGAAERIFTDLPGSTFGIGAPALQTLTITGSLSWQAANRIHIAASTIESNTAGSAVSIEAPYVLLTGGGGTGAAGSSTLTIKGRTIDVEGASFSRFAEANLISSGDIRLSTPKVANTVDLATGVEVARSRFTGRLASQGDLRLEAQRIYPVTAVDFTIQTPGKVTFAAPAGSNTSIPLSAGGSITVFARTIEQGGNLFAPLGKITLGSTNLLVSPIVTETVTLRPGSLTSVALADTVVPYGATSDGTSWYYNATLNPLSQPPSKGLVLDGQNVETVDGSVIDLRGGGDIQAMEWIAGNGGSRDTLTTTPSGQTVYALVPSRNDPVSAFDIHFTTARSPDGGKTINAGDAYPLAGTQITIDGGNGVPAGTYTLYPAHYATLPGAMRVVYYGSNVGRNVPSGTTLPDGTVLVAGHYTQSTAPEKQSSGQSLFAVQTGEVWRQYSEYSFNGANRYFTQQAVKTGAVVPRLPMDAGRLAVIAQQSILLDGVALTQPGKDSSGNIGRGSELDIAVPHNVAVVSDYVGAGKRQAYKDDGYLVLDVDQLNGFESVLIGGLRSDTATGTLITPATANVVVDTPADPNDPTKGGFTAPEILLVAREAGQWQALDQWVQVGSNQVLVELPIYQPLAGTGSVTITGNSVVQTVGTVHTGFGRNFYFATSPQTPAEQVRAALNGTLDPSGTLITGADLTRLQAFWFWDGYSSVFHNRGIDVTSLAYYAYGGATTQQPGLGALFAASNDSSLVLSGPAGTPVSPLTIQFANVGSGALPGVPVSGAVTGSVTLPGNFDAGRVSIEAGARVSTNTLTLQATASTNAIVIEGSVHADQLNLTAQTIGIGTQPGATGRSVMLASNSPQLADVKGLGLKALSGAITVYGDFNPGASVRGLTLDARTLARADTGGGAKLSVDGGTITLVDTGSAGTATSLPSSGGGFGLTLEAADIVLGGGTQAIAGYSAVSWTASNRVFVAGSGALTLGDGTDAVDLTVTTPKILVGGATATGTKSFALNTLGDVSIAGPGANGQRPADSSEVGGNLAITAARIDVDSTIQAQGGAITLRATTGDVTLGGGAYIAAGGYKKMLVDVPTYVPGGTVLLKADAGNVMTSAGSVIDVAQPAEGRGYGGDIWVSATGGKAALLGDFRGGGGPGLGGTFRVDAKSLELDANGVDPAGKLDPLAHKLLAGGLTGAVEIRVRTGNLSLSEGHTLKANKITLTADDTTWDSTDPTRQLGQIIIAGTIDASGYGGKTANGDGQAGGQVGLWGANAVTLTSTGKIDASTAHADERGGDVTIGVAWDAKSWDPVAKTGGIDLQPGSAIDVRGGTKGGLSGGTVTLRAPLDGNNDIKIARIKSDIKGARAVNVEAYLSLSTNGTGGIDASRLGWDGRIDPAGYYDENGNLVGNGSWTNVAGMQLTVNAGSGYTSVPTINFVDRGNSGATIVASLQVVGGGISVTNGGSYTSVPTITFAAPPGGGSAARGTARMGLNNDFTATGTKDNSGNPLALDPGTYTVRFTDPNNVTVSGQLIVSANGSLAVSGIPATQPGNVNFTSVPTQARIFQGPFTVLGTVSLTGGSMKVLGVNVTGAGNTGGSGYTSIAQPTISFSGGGQVAAATAQITSMGATATFTSVGTGYTGATLPTLTFSGGGGTGASASFAQVSNASGTTTNYAFSAVDANVIPFVTSGVFSHTSPTAGAAVFAPDPSLSLHAQFFTSTLTSFVQGNGFNGQNYGFGNIIPRLELNGLGQQLGAGVVHLRPGIELVNPDPGKNGGNITVLGNWNLAAGSAYNLQANSYNGQSNGNKYVHVGDNSNPAQQSYVTLDYRLIANYGTAAAPVYAVEPGALTLRAVGNIDISASISDGFFQFRNYLDPTYQTQVSSYVTNGRGNNTPQSAVRSVDCIGSACSYYLNTYLATPTAPYRSAANSASPSAVDLAAADLFPHQLNVCVSGAASCGTPNQSGAGIPTGATITTVTNPGSWSYRFTPGADLASANPNARVSLASGQKGDVTVNNHTSYTQATFVDRQGLTSVFTVDLPTMVRTGTGNINISAARDVVLSDTVAPGVIYAAGVNTEKLPDPNYSLQGSNVVANNPAGFFEPQILAYGNSAANQLPGFLGPPTAAAFPHMGGDVTIDAQRDIVGYSGSGNKTPQFYQPWLLSDVALSPATSSAGGAAVSLLGAGVFAPLGDKIASQAAWWIQYGSFRQGILSAGGNVTVTAGRDLVDVSVSLPTTGRVSGGLSATNTPVTHVYDSGNMIVRAGRDILGGSFYEGSGHASIVARGSIGQNGTVSRYATNPLLLPDVPLLAVDLGQIEMVAGGSVSIAGVINPAGLHAQTPSFANPKESGSIAAIPLFMDTYGPDSAARVVALSGDVTIGISPTSVGQTNRPASASMYPASFEAIALGGSIITTGISQVIQTSTANVPMPGIVLSPSENGTFNLLAQGSIDLTFGYPKDTFLLNRGTPRPLISAGPALINAAFDPFRPNSGFDGAASKAILAHQDDDNIARIYAATGDITGVGSYGARYQNDTYKGYWRVEINRPTKVYAGRDIIDLNMIVQNIHKDDVSTVEAGRNITYTGFNNAGGLQVAGPGFFVVQAGGDIGPFLPAAHNTETRALVQEGIASVGNASLTPVGNIYVDSGSIGIYDTALLGPRANPRRNPLLPTSGADIVVMFGAKYGADYQAVIDTYINPTTATKVGHNYIDDLKAFLERIGKPASGTDPTSIFDTFKTLPADLQHVFVDQVFFAELKAVGINLQVGVSETQRGYDMINTMFPANLGYAPGAKTGDLNLLHSTIQTQRGGDISIFGPGGNIVVGPLTPETNDNLKLRDIGILTLGGGAINTFTDGNVSVNASRVLTTQGGDILMWSSNGDLDAGRGSKTTLSQPPLQVIYDQDDYQSVDLGGFVSGAGIGVLKSSSAAKASNLYLLAPRGRIDLGTAGARTSGAAILLAPIIANSSNIVAVGPVTGIPTVTAPNVGALTAGSNAAGAAAKSAEQPTAAGNRDRASVFIVEVIGYGGGEGGQTETPTGGQQQEQDKEQDKKSSTDRE